jgi:hypothetical protein
MITGIGIPSSQSSSPLPIVRFPGLFAKKGSTRTRTAARFHVAWDHAANATSIQLHLAVTNELREPSVPVTKGKT